MAETLKFIFLLECASLLVGATSPMTNLVPDDDGVALSLDLVPDALVPAPMMKRNDFFLKAAKSVPRIGRRNDFFYAKTLKSVPRIGRRNDYFMNEAENQPRLERRDFDNPSDREAVMSWPWFRDQESLPRVLKRGSSGHEVEEFRQQALV